MKKLITLALAILFCSCNSGPVKHSFIAAGSHMDHIVICNELGEISWSHKVEGECNDVSLLSNGNILYAHKSGAREITRDKKIVWQYKGDKKGEVQSVSQLPGGGYLVAQNGSPARLLEFNAKGKLTKKLIIPSKARHPHAQARQVRKTAAGTYLVSGMKGQAREFDAQGKLIRTFAVGGNVFVALRLANGNTLIACGDAHKIVEIDPKGKVVWELKENDIPGIPLRFVAGLQLLPNGNIVIANWGGHGHKGKQAQIFEITRDKKLVWQVFDNKKFSTISTVQLLDAEGIR